MLDVKKHCFSVWPEFEPIIPQHQQRPQVDADGHQVYPSKRGLVTVLYSDKDKARFARAKEDVAKKFPAKENVQQMEDLAGDPAYYKEMLGSLAVTDWEI